MKMSFELQVTSYESGITRNALYAMRYLSSVVPQGADEGWMLFALCNLGGQHERRHL